MGLVLGYRSPGVKSVFSSEKLVLQAVFDVFCSKTPLFYANSRFLCPYFSIYCDFFGFADAVSLVYNTSLREFFGVSVYVTLF